MSRLRGRVVMLGATMLLLRFAIQAQPSQTLSLPPESPRWELEGQAEGN